VLKKAKMTTVEMVPIYQLFFAADAPKELGLQVRKGSDEEGLPTLEASIRAHGVIVPLVVKKHKGKSYVTAGNRRLKLLRKIHGDLDVEVPVVDSDAYPGDPREIAMATNVALPPHPIDRYEIIAALVGEGMSPEDAKIRFGLSDRQYNQIMKLGTLAPSLRDKWRDGEIDGAVAQALTMSDNPAEQEKVYATAKKGAYEGRVDARNIKSRLVPDSQRELGKLVEFIGVDEIEKAGLIKQRDWFAASHVVTDPKAVKKMVVERLSAIAAELMNKQGWSWAVGIDEIDRAAIYSYGHAQPDKKGNYSDEQKKKSGCILDIGYDGKLKIDYGRVKPSERKKVEGADRRAAAPKKKAKAKDGDVVLTNALAQRLSEQLQRAGAEALKADHAVATSAVIAAISSGGHILDIHVGGPGRERKASAFADVFIGALKATPEAREAMLAQIAAQALSIVVFNGAGKMPLEDEALQDMFEAMNGTRVTDAIMREFDAKDYFSSVGMGAIVDAVRCSMGGDHHTKVGKMKKPDAAKFAAANVPKTGYLPKQLRTEWYTGPVELTTESELTKLAKKGAVKKTAKKKTAKKKKAKR
jgi:ParB family chromosome partitioning protein